MKFGVWVSILNCGRGTAKAKFFVTEEDARADAVSWGEECITWREFEVDMDGKFLNPDKVETFE